MTHETDQMTDKSTELLIDNTVMKTSAALREEFNVAIEKYKEKTDKAIEKNQEKTEQLVVRLHESYKEDVINASTLAKQAYDLSVTNQATINKIWAKVLGLCAASGALGGFVMFVIDKFIGGK